MSKSYEDIVNSKYQILVENKSDRDSLSQNVFKYYGNPVNYAGNHAYPFYFSVKSKLERYKGSKRELSGSDEVIYTANVSPSKIAGYKIIKAKEVVK